MAKMEDFKIGHCYYFKFRNNFSRGGCVEILAIVEDIILTDKFHFTISKRL
jgi:hypothetical protein